MEKLARNPECGPETDLNRNGNRRGQSEASRDNLKPGDWRTRKAADEADAVMPADPARAVLSDMQHVYQTPASKDDTQGKKTCRKFLKRRPDVFMVRMIELMQRFGDHKQPVREPS